MSRRPWLPTIVAGGLLLAGLVLYLNSPSEPEYQGMRLSTVLNGFRSPIILDACAFLHPEVNRSLQLDSLGPGVFALRNMGTNVLPRLEQMLREREFTMKPKLIRMLGRQHLIKVRLSPASSRCKAMVGFLFLGDISVPSLERALKDPDPKVSEAARRVLDELQRRREENSR